jgi:hypothetical protein
VGAVNKPLTKEERENFIRAFSGQRVRVLGASEYVDVIKSLISAEAFWRESVKKCEEEESDGITWCPMCRMISHKNLPMSNIDHSADCPWLLAQES